MSKFKYITVLDFESGQVYLYDFDAMAMPNAEEVVALRHNLDNVQYMVHKYAPALWTKDLYYCSREDAYRLQNEREEE
jgi:hypothetical protein